MSEFLFHQTCLWSAGWSLIPNQQYQDGRQVHQIMSEGLVHCSRHLLLQVGRGVLNNSQIHHEHYFPDLTMAMGVYRTQKLGSECECVCMWPCVCVCMCVCMCVCVCVCVCVTISAQVEDKIPPSDSESYIDIPDIFWGLTCRLVLSM